MNPLIILLIFAGLLLVTMVFGVWFMNYIVRRYIGEKHHYLDEITQSGTIPESWKKKYDAKINKLRNHQADEKKILAVKQKANKVYLKKLKRLENYIKSSKLVESEQTRKIILNNLRNVYSKWEVNY